MATSDDPQNAKSTRGRNRKAAKPAKADRAPSAAEPSTVATFDRSQLTEKTRVFHLAKALGLPSKTLIIALNELGLVKVAQSTLTRAESNLLIDALVNAADRPTSPASDVPGVEVNAAAGAGATASEADQKIRERVRKDVQNEIKQIETKVERDLEGEVVTSEVDELLTNVEPEITPAPEDAAAEEFVPLFKAPSRTDRRRAKRVSTSEAEHASTSEPALDSEVADQDEPAEVEVIEEPKAIRGSSRLEAQRRRRTEKREEDRKRSKIVSQAEFLARRESVERTMVVRERDRREGPGTITQVGVLEDGLLVEHFVTSDQNASMIGNIYLGRVQNVLPSMEAAFIDIGQARNGVLYAGEVDWKTAGLGGRSRRIEQALKSGDQVLVQVTKDPIGHKGVRLTTQISLAGRFLVYVPGGRSAGISRKLPAPERKRLKEILGKVVPGKGGTIIRTAAEGVPEDAIAADVNRLHNQWQEINKQAEQEKKSKGAKAVTLYEEPNLLVKVIRDLFNEDFAHLIVDGQRPWNTVHAYVTSVAPDLSDRLVKFDRSHNDGQDAFEVYRIDEQIQKALSRTVWLPSGGTLIIDRTEAMTVIDVNTGKFTGSGGSLEETVTRNNLEAAEEIVRQMRLRDLGGMIVVDFIDMILPENQELVLRRLKEALGRDRTRHQVSEVTSLGLVQMTRKRLGTGLVETFSAQCQCCAGRGIVLTEDPVDAHLEHHESENRSSQPKPQTQPHGQPEPPAHGTGEILLDENALNELANSVVTSSGEPEAETDSEGDLERENHSRGRRRGRRGSGRGKGRPDFEQRLGKEQPVQQPEKDTARQSFEKAVEEFETSPRRSRRTRGNSRSDHRPSLQEFEQEHTSPEPAESQTSAPTVKKAAPSRNRRRAVRRTTVKAESSPASVQTHSDSAPPQPKQHPSEEERTSRSTHGRGRRRASRRQSSQH